MGTAPTTTQHTMETIQDQLSAAKLVLSQAQTEYQHCFARGDWTACSKAKRKVAKCMKEVQYLVAQKLAVC